MPSPERPERRLVRLAAFAGLFLVASAVALFVTRPFGAAPIAFDTAASVLHFDRIVSGHHLETPITTTPKPLLTLIYGLLHALLHDWRAISLASIGAWALSVVLAARLAERLGGLVAAAFVAAAFIGSRALLQEVALGLGSVWAILFWIVAGLIATSPRPRWGAVGLALGLAALARLESLLVIGLVLVVLAAMRHGPARIRRPVPRGAWLVGIGLAALPVMLLHDWLLTGNPLFWTTVSQHYSDVAAEAGRVTPPGAVAAMIAGDLLAMGGATALAIAGTAVLVVRRQTAVALGLLALGPGVATFLLLLAYRGIFVPARYTIPIEAAVLFAAGIGLGAIRIPEAALERLGQRIGGQVAPVAGGRLRPTVVAGGAVIVAILVTGRFGPLDHDLRVFVRSIATMNRAADLAVPAVRRQLAAIPGVHDWPGTSTQPGTAEHVVVLGPGPLRPRLAVDLDLPLPRIGATDGHRVDLATGYPGAGQVLIHDAGSDLPADRFRVFEIDAPARIGSVTIVPLLADPRRRVWVVEVRAAP